MIDGCCLRMSESQAVDEKPTSRIGKNMFSSMHASCNDSLVLSFMHCFTQPLRLALFNDWKEIGVDPGQVELNGQKHFRIQACSMV